MSAHSSSAVPEETRGTGAPTSVDFGISPKNLFPFRRRPSAGWKSRKKGRIDRPRRVHYALLFARALYAILLVVCSRSRTPLFPLPFSTLSLSFSFAPSLARSLAGRPPRRFYPDDGTEMESQPARRRGNAGTVIAKKPSELFMPILWSPACAARKDSPVIGGLKRGSCFLDSQLDRKSVV